MAFTTTQLSAIEDAIGTGQLTVTFDGKTITYRTMDDLVKAYNFIYSKLEAQGVINASSRKRVSVAQFDKG